VFGAVAGIGQDDIEFQQIRFCLEADRRKFPAPIFFVSPFAEENS
jgi:hypothetical protein